MRNRVADGLRRAHGRIALLAALSASLTAVVLISTASASTHARAPGANNPVCQRAGIRLSAGANMYCFGPQGTSAQAGQKAAPFSRRKATGPANANAASPSEDIAPNGTRAYGQSEESVWAVGKYVVEAWNDSTGFFANCGAANNKEELTGFGFSNNGGKSFKDLGGLPNSLCSIGDRWSGDPSVVGWTSGGTTRFYISSLFSTNNGLIIALDVCTVSGSGSTATLSCSSTPTIVAGPTGSFGFYDKEFMAIDTTNSRLYLSYTNFTTGDSIDLAACDISGTHAAAPVCSPGNTNAQYYQVKPTPSGCGESEGAYPALDPSTGDLYVAWEYNWATNLNACNDPTTNNLAYVPHSCLTLPTTTCSGATKPATSIHINSMDSAFIPGYNRFPMSDFPRIAVSDKSGTVSMVWNDAGRRATGDILLQSYHLAPTATFSPVQSMPVRLNNNKGATWAFMPALRTADSSGLLDVIWFDRRGNGNSRCGACTDVYAALKVSPTTTKTPKTNVRITNVTSNWLASSSDIVPNFGDYTDLYTAGKSIYAAWADGRLGVPQPFFAKTGG